MNILTKLRELKIELNLVEGKLKVKAPEGVMTNEILKDIKDHKDYLLQYLEEGKQKKDFISIPKVAPGQHYVLSAAQQRLFFLNQLDKGSLVYNMPKVITLKGKLDKKRFENAIKNLIRRHESLRTSFVVIDEEPVQIVHDEVAFKVDKFKAGESDCDVLVSGFMKPFALDKAPLFRVGLIEVTPENHLLMFDMHHIITDGVSEGIITRDFMAFYSEESLPLLNLQYKDFAEWEQSKNRKAELADARTFWMQQFEGEIPALDLPYDFARPAIKNFAGDSVNFQVPAIKLKKIAEATGCTMFMVLLSIYNILLGRLSNQKDIVVGTPTAGRRHVDLNDIVGMFVNTIPLRNSLTGNSSFADLLTQVKTNTAACFDHQAYSYDALINDLKIERDASRNPLFDVMFAYQNFEETELTIEGLELEPYTSSYELSKFDLTLTATVADDKVFLNFEYATSLFKRSTIYKFIDYFKNLVEEITSNVNILIKELVMIPAQEKTLLLEEFSGCIDRKTEGTVVSLLEKTADENGSDKAVVFEKNALTYSQLNNKSNQLAWKLIKDHSIKIEDKVAIILPKSEFTIIALYGTLKSGAAYVPVNYTDPLQRIQYIIKDSGVSVVITDSKLASEIKNDDFATIAYDTVNWSDYSAENPTRDMSPAQLAYIIYTSGTTGVPKGVMIEHRAMLDYIITFKEYFDLSASDIVIHQAALSFDTAVEEIYPVLSAGGTLLVLQNGAMDINDMVQKIKEYHVTILSTTPLVLNELNKNPKYLGSLRALISGGDELKESYITQLRHIPIYNTYGPTESTVCATYNRFDENPDVSVIGTPISGRRVYIIGENMELVPAGVKGEIALAGTGLARGYINNDALTAEKFILNPFVEGEKVYLTGDMGRWTDEGQLVFLGRKDSQVKIRGFRIELGEIESLLAQCDKLKEAVVTVREIGNDKYIVAYYVSDEKIDASEFRKFLQNKLPEYMVPTSYIWMQSFPLTSSGKLDKKALPQIGLTHQQEYVAPENDIERQLIEIWANILDLDKDEISTRSSFFVIGGHSLKAMKLVSGINSVMGANIELKDVFAHPTIAAMAEIIHSSGRASDPILPLPVSDYYDLSNNQKRLWFAHQLQETRRVYNLQSAYNIRGGFNTDAFIRAFDTLVDRHEILRTTFHNINGEPKQKVCTRQECHFKVDLKELSGDKDQEEQIRLWLVRECEQEFDLEKGPLIRVGLLMVNESHHICSITMHHIVTDEWSMNIVFNEVLALYGSNGANQLPELTVHYKEYAAWQKQQLTGERLKKLQNYWHERFADNVPVINLTTDKPRPAVMTYNGDVASIPIDAELTEKLRALTQFKGSTMYVTLLAAIKILLNRYTGQNDIVIGSPIAERSHRDLEDQIGFYVNLLALRTTFSSGDGFDTFLDKVKETVFSALAYQEYPTDMLIEDLNPERDLSRSPLFDVGFTWQANTGNTVQLPGDIQVTAYEVENKTSRADLWFFGQELDDRIAMSVQYNTDLFEPQTIKRMLLHLKGLLCEVTGDYSVHLNKIDYMSKVEKELLINGFNQTKTAYPSDKSIQQVFEEQAKLTPEATAIVYQGQVITYSELSLKSSRLASYILSKHFIAENDHIALMLDRSPDMIVAILGILKSGAAYVPVDPAYPIERKKNIIEDAGVKLLITDSVYMMQAFEFYQGSMLIADIESEEINNCDMKPIITGSTEDTAYVMYTSGSTGRPKGVVIKHKSVVRLVRNTNFIQLGPSDRLLPSGSLSFDASTFELWGMLLNGGSLYLYDQEIILEAPRLEKILKEDKITTLWLTSALFNELSDSHPQMFSDLKWLLAGGDKLSPKHINRVRREYPDLKIINGYGPTENTTFSLCHTIDKEYAHAIPIGSPIANSTAYIFDEFMQIVPIGVAGEICVGGDGLASCYLNNETFTSEKFVPHPYHEGQRIYRTGDLGKRLPDGTIEFIGRRDSQVKIRGFRIEPGEVEYILSNIPDVGQGVIVVGGNEGEQKYLIAYYTALKTMDASTIEKELARYLPAYLLPAYYIQVPSMPLTPNGKVDRKALPVPESQDNGASYQVPQLKEEKILTGIWQEVLHKDKIGITDNFFSIGGDSIKAIRMISKANQVLNTQIEVKDVFQYPDIQSLWQAFKENSSKTRNEDLEVIKQELDSFRASVLNNVGMAEKLPEDWEDIFPMSNIQEGMLYHGMIEEGAGIYHDQLFTEIKDPDFDFAVFKQGFLRLVEKHAVLRSSFHFSNFGQPVQIVHRHAHDNILFEDLRYLDYEQQEQYIREYMIDDLKHSFSPENIGLWRIAVFKLSDVSYGVLWIFHHAILDGWSVASLQTELSQVYIKLLASPSFKPKLLRADHKDYIAEQLLIQRSEEVRDFWKTYLKNYVRATLPLSSSYKSQTALIKAYNLTLEVPLCEALEKVSRNLGVSISELFLSAFIYTLRLINNEDDITIGVVAHGRPDIEDGDRLIGCFLNTIPVRQVFDGDEAPEAFIRKVSANLRRLKLYDKLPLAEIVKCTGTEGGKSNPFFDIIYNFIDFHIYEEASGEASATSAEGPLLALEETTYTNTLLDLTVSKLQHQYQFNLSYRNSQYSEEVIKRILNYLITVLQMVTGKTDQKLTSSQIIDNEELEQLLSIGAGEFLQSEFVNVVNAFETVAEVRSSNEAVLFEDKILTYQELNAKANQLARHLIDNYGVKREDKVGIMLQPSERTIIALLAVLKSGASYVPVNHEYPGEGIRHLAKDSSLSVLITEGALVNKLIDIPVAALDLDDALWQQHASENLNLELSADQLAYIIYTSGSTGKPKGVMIDQGALADYVSTFKSYFKLTNNDHIIHQASLSFDTAVEEIYPVLCTGGKLTVLKEGARNIENLLDTIKRNQVTILSTTPLVLNAVNHETSCLKSLRFIISGGDELKDSYISNLRHIPLFNTYGPTESTVCATYYKLENDADSNIIGSPIANRSIYLINDKLQLVPHGAVGEIAIAGNGLARGYLNNDTLTAAKFVANPWGGKNERMYLTGDLAKWNNDGHLVFLGRKDRQVKLRGFRIELGEIENQLAGHEKISSAVVVCKASGEHDKQLLAYYTADAEVMDLAAYLKHRLPKYMIPSYFMKLDALPMLTSGKVNLKALPDVVVSNASVYKAPTDDMERKLVTIWSDVLGVQKEIIGVNHNFFELGGHSLSATKLLFKIKGAFNARISLVDIFDAPTILEFAEKLKKGEKFNFIAGEFVVNLSQHYEGNDNLFFIHDGSGDVQSYMELASLINDYNSWGIRSSTLNNKGPVNKTLEELAQSCIEKIDSIQPEGPYHLAGWSLGGKLAYEIAFQLEQRGDKVEHLVLLDTELTKPNSNAVLSDFSIQSERSVISSVLSHARIEGSTDIESIWNNAVLLLESSSHGKESMKNMIPESIKAIIPNVEVLDVGDIITYFNTIRTVLYAEKRYQYPENLKAVPVYIKASTTPSSVGAALKGKARFFEISGGHHEMIKKPAVFELAEIITGTLPSEKGSVTTDATEIGS